MAQGIRVTGLANVQRSLRSAEKDVRLGIRGELRGFAEPTRLLVEYLAIFEIEKMTLPWSRMRTGITLNSVYIAPREKGARGIKRYERPNFSRLMMDRAMQPALDWTAPELVNDFNDMLNRVAFKFNRSGTGVL